MSTRLMCQITTDRISGFAEDVYDLVAAILTQGTNVTLTPNDGTNTVTIAASGGGGGGASLSTANTWTATQTFTPATAAGNAAVVKGLASQSGDYFQVRDSGDNARLLFSPAAVASGKDGGFLALRPGTRDYRIGTHDAAGAMIFSRSDSGNALIFTPDSSAVAFRVQAGILEFQGSQSSDPIIFCGSGAGGTGPIQFGRRLSDSATSVGANVQFWPATSQSSPAVGVMAPGGGSYTWQVMEGGAQQSPSASLPAVVARGVASQSAPLIKLQGQSSTTVGRDMGGLGVAWSDSTDATRKADVLLLTDGYNGPHEALRCHDTGSSAQVILPVASVPDAADDSIASGLSPAVPVGGLYRTGNALKIRLA